jgi:hypothetical protein
LFSNDGHGEQVSVIWEPIGSPRLVGFSIMRGFICGWTAHLVLTERHFRYSGHKITKSAPWRKRLWYLAYFCIRNKRTNCVAYLLLRTVSVALNRGLVAFVSCSGSSVPPLPHV